MATLLREYVSLDYKKELVKEAKEKKQPIVVKALLQRADAPNQNKRIYPREILEREIENFKKAVEENRATGECVPGNTEILTEDGWKEIKDVRTGESVYTLDLQTNEIVLQKIEEKIYKPYKDKIIHLWNDHGFDMYLTKNHKVLLWDRYNKPYNMTAAEFYEALEEGNSKVDHSYLKDGDSQILNIFNVKKELVDYDDYVYCVRVPNKTWMMRSNNKDCWTHNCDHPDSSIVSLQNVSHIIRDVWWDNDSVMGTVEVLSTPKGKVVQDLMEAGVKLGISSRGVGETIKNEDGNDVVDESFMLIAFDLVSEPSTNEAWLMKESKEVSVDNVREMIPKVDRINRIVNEILKD